MVTFSLDIHADKMGKMLRGWTGSGGLGAGIGLDICACWNKLWPFFE